MEDITREQLDEGILKTKELLKLNAPYIFPAWILVAMTKKQHREDELRAIAALYAMDHKTKND